jgi:phage shock protein C
VNTYKSLSRSYTDKMIGGVAGGMAKYFEMDSAIVRFLFILITMFFGTGVWVYIVLWIVLPYDTTIYEPKFSNPSNSSNMNTDNANPTPETDPYQSYQEKKKAKKENGNFIAGIVLITIGVLFLISQFVPHINFGDLWPVILIVVGGLLLRNYFMANKPDNNQ